MVRLMWRHGVAGEGGEKVNLFDFVTGKERVSGYGVFFSLFFWWAKMGLGLVGLMDQIIGWVWISYFRLGPVG